MPRRIAVLFVIAVMFCLPIRPQVSAITTAITTAIPLIQKVIQAIFPNPSKSVKGTDANAKAKQGLSPDVTKGVAQIQSISTELKTVDDFVLNCSIADRDTSAMTTMIAGAPSKPDASQIKTLQFQLDRQFTEVKGKLGNLSKDGTAVQALDTETAKVLLAIVGTNTGLLGQIDGDIKALGTVDSAFPALRDDLDKLSQTLADGMSVAGITLSQVAAGLDEVAKQGAQQAGVTAPPPAADTIKVQDLRKGFGSLLVQRYPALTDQLK